MPSIYDMHRRGPTNTIMRMVDFYTSDRDHKVFVFANTPMLEDVKRLLRNYEVLPHVPADYKPNTLYVRIDKSRFAQTVFEGHINKEFVK